MRAALALLAGALLATASSARADDARIDAARQARDALDFEHCIGVLAQPAPPESTDLERGDAEVLAGACWFELGKAEDAAEHFRRGLRIHPRALLPPNVSPKIVDAFARAQADVRAESERAPPPPPPARPEPAPVARVAPPADAHAGPPIVALSIAGAAVVMAAIGSYGYLHARSLESDANAARFESDAYALGDRAKSSIAVANVGFVSALALAAIALGVWATVER